jgi:hypothetical protein
VARPYGKEATISSACSILMRKDTSSSMRSFSDELRALLRKEFYADNLAALATLAHKAAVSVDRPLAYCLLWWIFLALDKEWRERPLTVEVANRMREHLAPSIDSYLAAVRGGLSPETEMEYLNEISRQFLSWLEIQRDLSWH